MFTEKANQHVNVNSEKEADVADDSLLCNPSNAPRNTTIEVAVPAVQVHVGTLITRTRS